MEIAAATLVADIAAHHPRSIEVFERELQEQVHLENNVLFPRVVSLQARAEGRGGPAGGAR